MKLPLGFRYSSTYAGIRKDRRDDLALIVADPPASAAAMFTTNRVQAAPVRLGREHLKASRGRLSAVLVNAGNANCATRTGDRVAASCCRAAAKLLKVPAEQILPSSTGVIGVELDGGLITQALPGLVASLSENGFEKVSRAIMTTDLAPKTALAEVRVGRGTVRIAGMTKGSGMIHPLMATTLAFVLTDAAVAPRPLAKMLRLGAERSFHRLSVDGDTSTNDTLVVMAGGASGLTPRAAEGELFAEALAGVLESLARQIAVDGEGARKLVTISVKGAESDEAASRIARAIANSPLVKTAIAGSDPNWGRILSAAGMAGVAFDPAKVDILLQGVSVCRGGLAAPFDEAGLKSRLDEKECEIRFEIRGQGLGRTRFWTCDLTEGYIRINASYRT